MSIDKSGKWWIGTGLEDIREYLEAYSADGYPVVEFRGALCPVAAMSFDLRQMMQKVALSGHARRVEMEHLSVTATNIGKTLLRKSGNVLNADQPTLMLESDSRSMTAVKSAGYMSGSAALVAACSAVSPDGRWRIPPHDTFSIKSKEARK